LTGGALLFSGKESFSPKMLLVCGALLALTLASISGCSKAPTATDSADQATAASTAAAQKGNGTAKLAWIAPTQNSDGSKITGLAGYYIYYGTSPSNLNQRVQVSDPGAASYTVGELRSGVTYYFSVIAYTASDTRGVASATVSKFIP
jgi:Fibronectin type III domain